MGVLSGEEFSARKKSASSVVPALLYDAIVHIACALLRRGASCLVFLPGKQEIQQVHDAMLEAGMQGDSVISLHADLEDAELSKALRNSDRPTARLSTYIAETSITLPQVEHVLDSGFSRTLLD